MLEFRTTRWVAVLVAAGTGGVLAAEGTVRNRLTNVTTGDIHVHVAPDGAAPVPSSLRVRTAGDPTFREPSRDGIPVPARGGWIEFEIDPLTGPKTKPDYHLAEVPFRIVAKDLRLRTDGQFNGHGVWNVASKAWDTRGFLVSTIYFADLKEPFTSIHPQKGAGKGQFEFIGFATFPEDVATGRRDPSALPQAEAKVPASGAQPVPAALDPAPAGGGKAATPPAAPPPASAAGPADLPAGDAPAGGQASGAPASRPPADPAGASGAGDPAGSAAGAPTSRSLPSFGPFAPTAVPFINACQATIELQFPDQLAEVQGDRNARVTPDGTRLTGGAGLTWDSNRARLRHKATLTFSFDFGHCGRFLVAGSHGLRFRAASLGGTHTAELQYTARCVAGAGGKDREYHAAIRDLPRAERRSGAAPAWPALPGASPPLLFTPLETLVFTAP